MSDRAHTIVMRSLITGGVVIWIGLALSYWDEARGQALEPVKGDPS